MVDILGRGEKKRKEEEAQRYKEEMALRAESKPQVPGQQDAFASLGRSVYMVMDPEVFAAINPINKAGKSIPSIFRPLIPAFSHLNRLTKTGKLQAELLELDYEELIIITKMNMLEDEYESNGWLALKSLSIFSQSIISDSFNGFKAGIVTTQLKTIRTELTETKKKKGPF